MPVVVALVAACLYLVADPMSLDLAAAEYRAQLFGREGFAVWDLQWYAGHHMPGYSVLVPALSRALGPQLVGAASAVAATVLFERLAWRAVGPRSWVGATCFAAGSVTSPISGRITFAAGLVPALGALVALELAGSATIRARRRGAAWAAVALALVTAATSPVAALFLALAGVTVALLHRGTGTAWAVAAASLAAIGALAWVFPEGGREPFVWSSFSHALWLVLLALVVVPSGARTVRLGFALYALALLATFLIPTPVGGNVTRLGALCAGPLLALALAGRGRRELGLALVVAVPLVSWQWHAAVDDVRTVGDDPSVRAGFYKPLLRELDRRSALEGDAVGGRVEIPFTRLHWESLWVAPRYALARGWERSLDVGANALFYSGRLTSARYRAWLAHNAVRWVALPSGRLDGSAEAEARLLRGGLPYLREVWRDDHWRLFAVLAPTGLADGPARVTSASPSGLALQVSRAGSVRLRVRFSPYWAITQGAGCVRRDGAWTRLVVPRPGRVRLGIRFALARIGASAPRCAT